LSLDLPPLVPALAAFHAAHKARRAKFYPVSLPPVPSQAGPAAEPVVVVSSPDVTDSAPPLALANDELPHAHLWLTLGGAVHRRSAIEIASAIAREHGFTLADLQNKSKKPRLMTARFAAYAAIGTERPDLSLNAIGRVLKRDHSSVLSGMRKMGVRP